MCHVTVCYQHFVVCLNSTPPDSSIDQNYLLLIHSSLSSIWHLIMTYFMSHCEADLSFGHCALDIVANYAKFFKWTIAFPHRTVWMTAPFTLYGYNKQCRISHCQQLHTGLKMMIRLEPYQYQHISDPFLHTCPIWLIYVIFHCGRECRFDGLHRAHTE
jgi:hypothetical protein